MKTSDEAGLVLSAETDDAEGLALDAIDMTGLDVFWGDNSSCKGISLYTQS